jgi:hypothetical protein
MTMVGLGMADSAPSPWRPLMTSLLILTADAIEAVSAHYRHNPKARGSGTEKEAKGAKSQADWQFGLFESRLK